MKNKVSIITTVHLPFDGRIFHKEAKSLANAGYKVTLIAQHNVREKVDEVNIVPLSTPRNRFTRIFGLGLQAFRLALQQKSDIYHFHDPELLIVGMLLQIKGAQVVYDVHENVPKQILTKSWVHPVFRKLISFNVGLLEIIASRFLSGIVAATPSIAERFPYSKTIVVQNFPLVEELSYSLRVPYSKRSPIAVYMGGISYIRGALEMVQAMARLPNNMDCKLLLMGKFMPTKLADDILSLDRDDRVKFLGWLDRSEMLMKLNTARVGLVTLHPAPNYLEAQPIKFFEYMAAGIPIVASDFPLWQKFIEEIGCGLLVNPLDPQSIANAIQWLLEHPKEAEAMGKRGKEAVLNQYNWSNEVKKLLALYGRLSGR